MSLTKNENIKNEEMLVLNKENQNFNSKIISNFYNDDKFSAMVSHIENDVFNVDDMLDSLQLVDVETYSETW